MSVEEILDLLHVNDDDEPLRPPLLRRSYASRLCSCGYVINASYRCNRCITCVIKNSMIRRERVIRKRKQISRMMNNILPNLGFEIVKFLYPICSTQYRKYIL